MYGADKKTLLPRFDPSKAKNFCSSSWRINGRNFFDNEQENSKLKEGILSSGIYEPELVLNLEVNQKIRLDEKMPSECNVMNKPTMTRSPIMVCAGGNEPEGWID